MRFLIFPSLTLAGFLAYSPLAAATLAQSYSADCFGFSDISKSSTNEQVNAGGGGYVNNGFSICSNSGKAVAGGGYAGIGAEVYAEHFGIRETSTVYSRAGWSDTFEITAPTNWTGGAIDVQVVFGLSANARNPSGSNSTDNASGFADFELLLSAQSSRAGTNPWSGGYSDRWEFTEWDPFDDKVINQSFISSPLSVVPGLDTLSLGIDFDVTAYASAPDGAFEVLFDGLKTASLATTGPAFILPDGFFVTNESANVYNNRWVDPRTVAPSPVPLPAGGPLLLAGLVALWFKGRRTGRQARRIAAMSSAAVCVALATMLPLQVNAATVTTTATIVANSGGEPTCGTATSKSIANPTDRVTVFDSGPACNAYAEVDINQGVIGVGGNVEQGLGSASSARISASGSIFATGIQLVPTDGLTLDETVALIGTEVTVTANLELDYQMGAILATASPFSRSAGSSLTANATLSGSRNFSVFRDSDSVSVSSSVTSEGSSSNAQTVKVLPRLTVDWTKPLGLTFGVTGIAGAFTTGDSSGGAFFNALESLSFATNGPAFLLPEQLTVFAPELGIYDNRWVDPRTPAPSPVPLPAGFPLLAAGLAALGLVSKKRRRS